MEQIECEGSTVAEAVESALKALGLRRDQVEVQIIQEGSAGILGFGRKPAKVRVSEKRWGTDEPRQQQGGRPDNQSKRPPAAPRDRGPRPQRQPETRSPRGGDRGGHGPSRDHDRPRRHEGGDRPRQAPAQPARPAGADRRPPRPAPAPRPQQEEIPLTPADVDAARGLAENILKQILSLMGIEGATAQTRWDGDQERVMAVVEAPGIDLLLGQEGKVLESLQFLTTVITTRELKKPVAVWVDALNYLEKREAGVLKEAQRGADIVKQSKKPFRLSPMDPAMRRLVHRTLANDPEVTTSSEGEGPWRKVVIRPKSGS
ncbi:MAG: Jag N-terminal domain-containing protein [Elusimicrobia bacterium]|nr:Jag N-terminal domain-containing protein [Elusimicrobiota bacterium]